MNDETILLTVTVNKKDVYYLIVSNPFMQWWVEEVQDFIDREKIKGHWVISDYKPLLEALREKQ